MNKYKEALETISGITCMNYTNDGDYCVGGLVGDEFQKELEILQELIDSYQEECDYHGEVLHDKEEEIAKLNKALDKACERIAFETTILGWGNEKEYQECVEDIKKELLHDND